MAKCSLLFVHGAWHGRSTWDRVLPLLKTAGFVAEAIDLPGAGVNSKLPVSFSRRPLDNAAFSTELSPSADVTQAQRNEAVISAIEALGGDVVLVGHSMGGLTISAVAEAVPEKLHALVYVTAFLLPPGMPLVAMIQHPTTAAALVPSLLQGDAAAVGALRIDPAEHDPDYVARMKEAFFDDVSEADFCAFAETLHCDEPICVALEPSAITAKRFGRAPRHYIRCTEDRAIPIAAQDFMIQAVDHAIGGITEVRTLEGSHSPFLAQPEALANILISIGAGLK